MGHILLYSIASAVSVVVLLSILSIIFVCVRNTRLRISKKWFLALMYIIILLPFLPYLVVECQTRLFGPPLIAPARQALKIIGESTNLRTYKVTYISPRTAKVYVVIIVPDELLEDVNVKEFIGYTLGFTRHDGRWAFDDNNWDVIWSDGGSADSNIFPPYRSKGEYK